MTDFNAIVGLIVSLFALYYWFRYYRAESKMEVLRSRVENLTEENEALRERLWDRLDDKVEATNQ